MDTRILRYNVIIKKEGKFFVAYVPTLGISDFGKSVYVTKSHVKGIIETHIEGLVKTKDYFPLSDVQ